MRGQGLFLFNRPTIIIFALLSSLIGSAISVTPVQGAGIVVNTEVDEAVTNGLCSLREAITNADDDAATYPDCAAGSGADTITFTGNYTITLNGSQLPVITTEITINGEGPENTIIQASTCNPVTLPGGCTPAAYRVFELSSPGNLTLDQLSVRHGRCWGFCNTTDYTGAFGGGIFFSGGTLTVTNSSFSGNWAGVGGGISFLGNNGTLTITGSTFSGNFGYDGAGINFQDALLTLQSRMTVTNSTFSGNSGRAIRLSSGMLTVTNSTFSDNSTGYDAGISNTGTATVTDSTFSGNSAIEAGAIGNYGTLTVINSTFLGNSATEGAGGAIINRGTLTVKDSTFSGNSAKTRGGGIWSEPYSNLEVTNSTFSGNQAETDSGGGIYTEDHSTLTVTNSTFSGNSATTGGGIYIVNHTTLNLANSTFLANSATGEGGGISAGAGNSANRGGNKLTITDSTFSRNTADSGGGLFFYRSDLTLKGSTFSENSATTTGGGIRSVQSGAVMIANSTVSGNTANTGGGLGLIQSGATVRNSTFNGNSATTGGGIQNANTSLTLANTIVANSPSGGNCAGGIINGGNNLDSGVSCKWGSQKGSMSNTDPKLGPLASNGGPTQTHALLDGSPAIDKGDATICSESPVDAVDQRGVSRPQGAGCDIGTYEKALPPTPSFGDVPLDYWAWEFIERLYNAGITGGCSTNPLNYCPEGTVTRAQMAVFLLKGIHTASYTPPAVGDNTGFSDVPTSYWAAAWIKQLAVEGITGGCDSGNYCPEDVVTRAQMAVFLLRAKHGASYVPPSVGDGTGFSDVPTSYWAVAWIKQLVAEGIASGCGTGTYCPESPVTRAQMAVFLVRMFNLP